MCVFIWKCYMGSFICFLRKVGRKFHFSVFASDSIEALRMSLPCPWGLRGGSTWDHPVGELGDQWTSTLGRHVWREERKVLGKGIRIRNLARKGRFNRK